MKVNKFLFVQVDSNRIHQLDDQIFNGCILLFFLLIFEKTVPQEQVMRSFNYEAINILLIDEGSDE